jgi:hypothetical protein
MMFGQQVIFVGIEMRAVRGRGIAGPPLARQLELRIQVHDIGRCGAQVGNVHMAAIDERQLIGGHGALQMPDRLGRPQAAAVSKGSEYTAVVRVFDLRI